MLKTLIASTLLGLGGYGLLEARPLLMGPSLSIASPENYALLPDGIATISGNGTRLTALSVNGARVLPNADGSFSLTLAFPKGESVLTFAGEDRFGKTISTTRTISVP